MTDQEKEEYPIATECCLCQNRIHSYFGYYKDQTRGKRRHHDHVLGKYIGPAHAACNLHTKQEREITLFFHNGEKFDFHFLLRPIKEVFHDSEINVISKTSESYLSFHFLVYDDERRYIKISFKDSYHFLHASLDKLAEIHGKKDGIKAFQHAKKFYPEKEKLELITKKGHPPYEYMDT